MRDSEEFTATLDLQEMISTQVNILQNTTFRPLNL